MHRPEVGAIVELEGNAFAQKPPQHLGQFAEHVAQRQHLGLHGLLAAEGQKLTHQGGGAQRVLMNLVDLLE